MKPHPMRRLQYQAMSRSQAGFTLVELITVIVILGVLAAVALPRYADLQGKARAAKVKAVAGSIKAATGLVKAQAMAEAVSCAAATGKSTSLEGLSIDLNHCYPQALGSFTTGVLGAANVDGTNDGWTISATAGKTGAAAAGSTVAIELGDAATPATCSVSYKAAADATTPPVVTPDVTGC